MEAGKASASDARPLLVIADEHEHDRVVWSRERPIGGIMAPVGPVDSQEKWSYIRSGPNFITTYVGNPELLGQARAVLPVATPHRAG